MNKKGLMPDNYSRIGRGGRYPVSRDYEIRMDCDQERCPFNDRIMHQCSTPAAVKIVGGVCSLWKLAQEKGEVRP